MKKAKVAAIAFAMLLALGARTTVLAQGEAAKFEPPKKETITAEGILKLQNGQIALVSGNTTYLVPSLMRYSGFIDGIKDGAKVKAQGYTKGKNLLKPTVITVNGKQYELSKGMPQGKGDSKGMKSGKHRGKKCR